MPPPARSSGWTGSISWAPELFDTEAVGALAGLERRGEISAARASEAVDDLGTSPVERFSHAALLCVRGGGVGSLRHNLSTNAST